MHKLAILGLLDFVRQKNLEEAKKFVKGAEKEVALFNISELNKGEREALEVLNEIIKYVLDDSISSACEILDNKKLLKGYQGVICRLERLKNEQLAKRGTDSKQQQDNDPLNQTGPSTARGGSTTHPVGATGSQGVATGAPGGAKSPQGVAKDTPAGATGTLGGVTAVPGGAKSLRGGIPGALGGVTGVPGGAKSLRGGTPGALGGVTAVPGGAKSLRGDTPGVPGGTTGAPIGATGPSIGATSAPGGTTIGLRGVTNCLGDSTGFPRYASGTPGGATTTSGGVTSAPVCSTGTPRGATSAPEGAKGAPTFVTGAPEGTRSAAEGVTSGSVRQSGNIPSCSSGDEPHTPIYPGLFGNRNDLDERESEKQKSKRSSQAMQVNNPDIADLSDTNRPTKLAERFSELYDNEWTEAFDYLHNKIKLEEHTVVGNLLKIVQDAYGFCQREADFQITAMQSAALDIIRAGKIQSNTSARSETGENKNMKDLMKEFRKQHAHLAIQRLQQAFLDENTEKKDMVNSAMANFARKAVEVTWWMNVQNPPVYMCPTDKEMFDANLYRAYTKTGQQPMYFVWPALKLYEKGGILARGVVQFE